ncbi:TPA: hypothetical protein R4Y06_003911 [Klebsiella pneumoniae]|nr:hypothetical protein [Klebsiella pneumoniae]
MYIRKDFEDVSCYISRLLSFSKQFSENNTNWSHLKNREDFRFIFRVPDNDRYKVEELYCAGRDMALYMAEALAEINYDFGKFPTLTSVVEGFDNSWVFGNYDAEIPEIAIQTCKDYNVDLWSVGQMYHLFKSQEKILSAIRVTLNILKSSNLYKLENGMEIMSEKSHTINVSGISGSSININSTDSVTTINQTYNSPSIFEEIIHAIKEAKLDDDIEKDLIDNTQTLAIAHEKGNFSGAYKDFMQNISAHITVFTAFLPSLAALLS